MEAQAREARGVWEYKVTKARTSIKVGGIVLAFDKALEEVSTAAKVFVGGMDASVENIDIGTLAGGVVKYKVKLV